MMSTCHSMPFAPEAAGGGKAGPIVSFRIGRPTGVAMQADPVGGGFHLVVLAGTQALMALGPYPEGDILAEWRRLGATTGLPLLVRLANGSTLTMVPKIGRVSVGSRPAEGRKAALGARRPSFLAGRRQGRVAAGDVLRN